MDSNTLTLHHYRSAYGIGYASKKLRYRLNAKSYSHDSNRTPLAKYSNSVEYVFQWALTRAQKKTSSEQLGKLKMIRVIMIMNYKNPVIGSYIVYQTIQAPFHNYTVLFPSVAAVYSCHRIPSSKHANTTSSCIQVYLCSHFPDLC